MIAWLVRSFSFVIVGVYLFIYLYREENTRILYNVIIHDNDLYHLHFLSPNILFTFRIGILRRRQFTLKVVLTLLHSTLYGFLKTHNTLVKIVKHDLTLVVIRYKTIVQFLIHRTLLTFDLGFSSWNHWVLVFLTFLLFLT